MRRALRVFAIQVAMSLTLPCAMANACHNVRNWPTGADLGKLGSDDVAVRAKLIESFKGEQNFPTIMGSAYGMIYLVEVTGIVGHGAAAKPTFGDGGKAEIIVRLRPGPCEQYVPSGFLPGMEKTLVVKKGAAGVYDLVGGEE